MKMGRLIHKFHSWKEELINHKELIFLSIIFIIFATMINMIAGNYTTYRGDSLVSDIIISNIPPINLNIIFVWLWLIMLVIFFAYPLFFMVSKLHEAISQFSLLTIMRSFFMSLTHLKTPIDAITPNFPQILQPLVFENDLFFSGHTAMPFLGFLLFKESKIRYLFLAISITLGITALLMHRHYTIDVFAAFFITYGTYHIGKWLFGKLDKGIKR